MRLLIMPLLCLLACACAGPEAMQASVTQTTGVDTSKMPQAGIFTVKDVIVTDQGENTLRLAAATTNKFELAQLHAVIWCRAREEASARKFDGWYQDGIQDISNGPGQPQIAIATAKYFKGKPPEGKKTLKQEKSPCTEVPAVARAKI